MREVLICTVGTSLLNNIDSWQAPDRVREHFTGGNLMGLNHELSRLSVPDRRLGAEINSVCSIIKSGFLARRGELLFFVSDTDEGRLTGKLLVHYFSNGKKPCFFEEVRFDVIEGLTDRDVVRFEKDGLKNLVKMLAGLARTRGAERILINATGGYKAQISFAGMIGQALDMPVCYLLEGFPRVIQLPPQPISLDLSFWLENAESFFALDDLDAEQDIPLNDRRFEVLIDRLECDGRAYCGFSPAGQLYHETFCRRFYQQRSRLLPAGADILPAKKKIRMEDDNRGKHPGLEHHLRKVCGLPYVKEIFTHYHNPDLVKSNRFRKSSRGDTSHVEGWFSKGGALTKFDVVTTASTKEERQACIADLNSFLRSGSL